MAKQLLRLPVVCERVGFKRSQIYALTKEGLFPKPIHLGTRSVAWDADQIESWIQDRIAQSCRAAA